VHNEALYISFPLIFGGQIAWLIASERAKTWLVENDPTYQREGVFARMFIGRLLTSFGPMSRYTAMRRGRGEPTTLSAVFWAGFATSMLGVALLFYLITQR
jgi:hypothetical protein